MTNEEMDLMIRAEEKLLRIGTPDFLRRHNKIMEEIEHIKSANRNIGNCDKRPK